MEDYYDECDGPFSLESFMLGGAMDFNNVLQRHEAVKMIRELGYVQVLRTTERGKPRQRVWVRGDGKLRDRSLHNRKRPQTTRRKTSDEDLIPKIREVQEKYGKDLPVYSIVAALGLPQNAATFARVTRLCTL